MSLSHSIVAVLSGISLICGGSPAPDEYQAGPSLGLELSVLENAVPIRDSLVLRLIVRNHADSVVAFIAPIVWPSSQLHFDITASEASDAPLSVGEWQDESPFVHENDHSVRIPPHGFVGGDVTVRIDGDASEPGVKLARPGKYNIRAYLRVVQPDTDWSELLTSNTVSVTLD